MSLHVPRARVVREEKVVEAVLGVVIRRCLHAGRGSGMAIEGERSGWHTVAWATMLWCLQEHLPKPKPIPRNESYRVVLWA